MSDGGESALHDRYARVFARADKGDPIKVWYSESGQAMTDLGPVQMPIVKGGHAENVGPIVLIRRSTVCRPRFFQMAGRGLRDMTCALKFDGQRRLYFTLKAENGTWTWQVRRGVGEGHFELDGYELYVGIWRD